MLENVRFRFLPEPLAAQAAMLAGEIDAFPNFPAPELLQALGQDPRFHVESGTTEGETLLAMNLRKPFFQDLRVRQSLAHAIDRRALIAGAMFDTAQAIGSHYPPHAPDYLDLSERKAYNPQRARRLLQKSGWHKNIPPLTLKLPPPPTRGVAARSSHNSWKPSVSLCESSPSPGRSGFRKSSDNTTST